MKKILTVVFFLIALLCVNEVRSQNIKNVDYIESGYYQLIYEANIANLEGNEDLAFEKLSRAEKLCPLLNQVGYREMDLYCDLLVKRRKYSEAINYMEQLVTKYGSLPFRAVETLYYKEDSLLLNDFSKEYPNFEDSIFPVLMTKYENFYTEERVALAKKLQAMCERDQSVRYELIDAEKNSSKSEEEIEFLKKRRKDIDALNASLLYEVLDQYGFPNFGLLGYKNYSILFQSEALFVHNCYDENLKKRVLQYVREGECTPGLYGFMVDRLCLETHTKYVYAIYDNVLEDQIEDIKRLDERRLLIGMPTMETEKKIRELRKK